MRYDLLGVIEVQPVFKYQRLAGPVRVGLHLVPVILIYTKK